MYQQHIVYKILALVVCWLLSFTALGADDDATNLPRMALVIGNSAYQGNAYLSNPVNDAQAIAKALKKLNFTVTLHKNLSLGAMKREVAQFSLKLRKSGGVGLFYFSGHGLQDAGENYLLPVGAEDSLIYAEQLPDSAVTVQWVLSTLVGARNRMNIVLIDACRNNPLRASLITDQGKGKLVGGLAATSSPPDNFIIGYAAASGKEALNGRGSNSPYVEQLLANLPRPGLNVETVLKAVRKGVDANTQGVQQPQYLNALSDEFVFNPSVGGSEDVPRDEPVVVAEPPQVVVPERQPFEPEMVAIPAGSFKMGSPSGEAGRSDDEGPVHRVQVKAFRMGKYEVTRGQFRAFVDATSYKTTAEQGNGCYGWTGSTWEQKAEFNWLNPGFAQEDNHPVVCVSWDDAVAYTQWLAKETNKPYRLPTEAEWEYAARAGTSTARFWGDNPDQACKYANVADQTKSPSGSTWNPKHECKDGYWFTSSVGSYSPNPWGLYDMLGNVWEWNQDKWHSNYAGAPINGSAWESGDSSSRLLRGCSWYVKPDYCRAANRDFNANPYGNLGFRVVFLVAGRAF